MYRQLHFLEDLFALKELLASTNLSYSCCPIIHKSISHRLKDLVNLNDALVQVFQLHSSK